MKNWLIASIITLGCAVAQAQSPMVRFHGAVGYSVGGDTLASGKYTDGTSYSVSAGQGLLLALGADFRVADKVTIQATVGHHQDSVYASNGEIAFKRSPVELLTFYDMTEQFRLGGGLRKAQNAELTATGAAVGIPGTGAYESTVGLVLEGQYFFNSPPSSPEERKPRWGLGVRIVGESYKPTNGSTGSRDGSHLAVSMLFYY